MGAKPPFSLAWPCGAAWVGAEREDVSDEAGDRFIAARNAWGGVGEPAKLDWMHVPSVDGAASLVSLQGWVAQAKKKGGWLVFMFHGVGGDHLAVKGEVHQALVQELASDPTAWVAPFGTVAQRLRDGQKGR